MIVKRIAIFYTVFESEEGIPSRGLVHPRTRVGGGARWIQVPAKAGTQETMGGAGRSEATGVPREGIPSSDSSSIHKKESDLSQLDFLVTLFFCVYASLLLTFVV